MVNAMPILDVNISEKSFGPKNLMSSIRFSINSGEKVGLVGRNGVGKSTLFNILSGIDKDYNGQVIYQNGTVVATTNQEHHAGHGQTVLNYILSGLPEYAELKHILDTYPETMGDNIRKITKYSDALERFNQKGFYLVEGEIESELDSFQLENVLNRDFASLSGGEKQMVEILKVMAAKSDIALIDEPTNHMDYVAKERFIKWLKEFTGACIVVTHDRDVLENVDRIIEIKDQKTVIYNGNYKDYLKQNTVATSVGMTDFELTKKRLTNLRAKATDYQRLKEKSRNPSTIKKFKRLENEARAEILELEEKEKPTFWIDKESGAGLDYKSAQRYEKYKTKNVRINVKNDESRTKHILVKARNLSLGYSDKVLFMDLNMDLPEGSVVRLKGRNGTGKTTFIKSILGLETNIIRYDGELEVFKHTKIGVYEQEVSPDYFNLTLESALERTYLDQNLSISDQKIRALASDYLFTLEDLNVPVNRLSGGQKARLQIIKMLATNPTMLILDEPTNHLDLPSIEEIESALKKYTGAILYVSHDNYFANKLGGEEIDLNKLSTW